MLLYSTNTWLAYSISQTYYGQEHYVWCAPTFDPASLGRQDQFTPTTSSPCEIYRSLLHETRRGDRHSGKVRENKLGIRRGADAKQKLGLISELEAKDIVTIAEASEIADFRPLLYVMPFAKVETMVRPVPVEHRAHPMSVEYVIERLPRAYFDILEFDWR